ncbi:hypothetical protein [Pontibacter chinhatensis]|uniref:Uncharacterized protein n=1 Tax=Pontibacter chinhatensis TaxID=1436961 RepID=A0A1I2WLH4_9BACT|nr:hypothetical protein [Pontibacter chinhatensis]SFH02155.1 hypothetical protein SAMN05421739_10596 [Pontibacter chinhatensis]
MRVAFNSAHITSWVIGLVVFAIGLSNLVLVHPVPGIVFLLLSLVYPPQVNAVLKARFGFSVPLAVKVILGLVIIWFTLGVSDLGDMID